MQSKLRAAEARISMAARRLTRRPIMSMRESRITAIDCFIITIISFVSLSTRLWNMQSPDYVVFDEVYFGNFTNWYINGRYFMDIHPPFGKLLTAGIAKLAGYDGNIDFVRPTSPPYEKNEIMYVMLREIPAIFQSFCFPLIYIAMRGLSFGYFSAFCASFSLLFESSMLVEGRFILSDGLLHFFCCLHLSTFAFYIKSPTSALRIISGLTLGMALTCKNTALSLLAFDGFWQLCLSFNDGDTFRDFVNHTAQIFFNALLVFVASNIIHIASLPNKGSGDQFLFGDYKNTLDSNNSYRGIRTMHHSIISRIFTMNYIMHTSNMKSTMPHPYQSSPLTWPFLTGKWVVFWQICQNRIVICLGSPLVFWPSSTLLALSAVYLIFVNFDLRIFGLLIGWAASYFPFLLIPRALYLYHYIIPLIFAVMNMSAICEAALPRKVAGLMQLIFIAGSMLCFAYFYPLTHGTYCEGCDKTKQWVGSWRFDREMPRGREGYAAKTVVKRGYLPEWPK